MIQALLLVTLAIAQFDGGFPIDQGIASNQGFPNQPVPGQAIQGQFPGQIPGQVAPGQIPQTQNIPIVPGQTLPTRGINGQVQESVSTTTVQPVQPGQAAPIQGRYRNSAAFAPNQFIYLVMLLI